MKKINILLSISLLFAGISALDIKAAAKSTEETKEESKPEVLSPERKTEMVRASKLLFLDDAINNNKAEQVKEALKGGVNINTPIKDGFPALILAVLRGRAEIVELLLNEGADVNVRDSRNGTALMGASDPNIVKLLLDAKANIDLKDNYGNTALILASITNNPEKIELLLKNGADIAIENNQGKTALDFINTRLVLKKIYEALSAGKK